MKKLITALLRRIFGPLFFGLLLALALSACNVTTGPTTVNVTVIVTQTFTLPAPVESNQAGCPAISKIRVNYPETLDRGSKAPISATPLDADGKQRPASCDDADGLSWTVQPSELLTVANPKAFDTEVIAGTKTGSATLSVSVGKSGSNSVPIKVQ